MRVDLLEADGCGDTGTVCPKAFVLCYYVGLALVKIDGGSSDSGTGVAVVVDALIMCCDMLIFIAAVCIQMM